MCQVWESFVMESSEGFGPAPACQGCAGSILSCALPMVYTGHIPTGFRWPNLLWSPFELPATYDLSLFSSLVHIRVYSTLAYHRRAGLAQVIGRGF